MNIRRVLLFSLTFAVALTAAALHPQAQTTGLVAAYGFDELTGGTVTDASGNGNTGTISGARRTAAGRYGGGLIFDGVNDVVSVANSASLNVTTGLTIEAWVLPTRSTGWQTAILKEAPGELRYALYASSDTGDPSGYVRVGSADRSVYAPAALPLDVWTHVTLTYDGATMRLYVDGSQAASRAQTGSIATSTGALRIGGNNVWGEYFQGTLDEIRIYNRALSAGEILTDLNTPITPQNAKLVITSPVHNATVTGTVVGVSYTTLGTLSGEEDHVHFLLDGATFMDPPPMDGAYQFSNVGPGVHVLGGYLARANHSRIPGTDATPINFTVVGPDVTAPTVTQTAPADGAVGVPVNTTVTATFSEAVNAATVTGATFTLLTASTQAVSATVAYDAAALRAVLTPASPLASNATYTALVKGGSSGVADVAGNVLTADVAWTFTTAAPAPPPPPTPAGLVAAYGFEEASGAVLNDLSGNGNNGAITGATWTPAGRFGSALTFNGTSNSVTVADAPSLDLTTGMTLEAWVYPTVLTGYRTVLMKEIPGELAYCLYAHDNAPRPAAYINTGGGPDPTTAGLAALPVNAWTHLAATFDGAVLRLFVNGAEVSSRAAAGTLTQSANPLRIGGNSVWGEYFQGRIDEIRVYNRALGAAEILADRDTPVSGGGGPVDSIPPSVSVTAPAPGSVAGTVTLTAAASDNVGVGSVQFQVDDSNVGPADLSAPYSFSWNTATATNGPHTIRAIARDFAGNQTTSAPVAVTVSNTSDPSQIGAWSEPTELGMVAVHLMLLHTGKLLLWRGETMGGEIAAVWDPAANVMTPVPNSFTNLFCAGHARLADGRILVAGGHDSESGILGSADANIFDPVTESWQSLPKMSQRRWYPTATTLPDGRVLVTSGGTTCFTCFADIPEIYDPVSNTWSRLTGARLAFPYYPFTFVLPDGRVLNAGAGEQPTVARVLNVATQTWTTIDPTVVDGGSAAMYRLGKVLKTGTAVTTEISNVPSAATAYVLDMDDAAPAWRQVAPMAFRRAYHNSTILPDGTVLITGGGSRTEGKNNAYAVYEAELWSPATETFQTMARMRTPRQYHGTALLMPDARVLVAGSGDSYGGPNQTVAEFYSPPYLFKGARPAIGTSPSEIRYGTSFALTSPDTASVTQVALIRLGSVTHQFDEDQRYLELSFVKSGNIITVDAPANANLAPPGHYMVFLLNGNGVPSTAAIVRLPSPAEDAEAPTAPSGFTATGAVSRADLAWAASTDNTGVSHYNVHRSAQSGFVPAIGNRIAQPGGTTYSNTGLAPGTYYYRVTASDVVGNVSPASPEAVAFVSADTTPASVSITSPGEGMTATGAIQVQASATDDGSVAGVRFKVDGVDIGGEDTTAPFSVAWNTATAQNGPHLLSAVARDAAGNTSESTAVSVTVSNAQTPSGLVAAYGFNEGAGGQALDATGAGHVGSITGATWTTSGRFGGALSFNGTTGQVTVLDAADLDLTTGMTVEAWVYPTALSGWRTVVMKEAPGTLAYVLYAHDLSPRPAAYVRVASGESTAAGTSAVPLNTWTHLAATYDGGTLRLHVNGIEVRAQTVTGGIVVTGGALTIGGNDVWGEHFSGRIDEVRIYNRALTAGEIQADMVTPISGG